MLKLYQDPNIVAGERQNCLQALGYTKDPSLIRYNLDISLDASVIRTQDTKILIPATAGRSAVHRYIAWDFLKEKLPKLDTDNGSIGGVGPIVKAVVRGFSSVDKLKELTQFFAAFPTQAPGAVHQALEQVRNNVEWVQYNKDDISLFLSNYK